MEYVEYPLNQKKFIKDLNLEDDVRLNIKNISQVILESKLGYKVVTDVVPSSEKELEKYEPNVVYFISDFPFMSKAQLFPEKFHFPKHISDKIFIDILLNHLDKIFNDYLSKIRTMYIDDIYITYKKDEYTGILVIKYYNYLTDSNLKVFREKTEKVNEGIVFLRNLIDEHEENVLSLLNIQEDKAYVVEGLFNVEYYGVNHDYSLRHALNYGNTIEEINFDLRLEFICLDDKNPYKNKLCIDLEVLGDNHYDNFLIWKNFISDGAEYRRKTSFSNFSEYFKPY